MKTKILSNIYKKLYSEEKVLNQEDFGQKIGIGKTYLSKLMNGHIPISKTIILLLKDEFNVNPEYFKNPDKAEMFLESTVSEPSSESYGQWKNKGGNLIYYKVIGPIVDLIREGTASKEEIEDAEELLNRINEWKDRKKLPKKKD